MTSARYPDLDLSTALPDRPVQVRPPATVSPLSAIGIFVLLGGLIAGAIGWLGPDILRDWRIGRDLEPARQVTLEATSCGTRVFLVKACELRLAGRPQTIWYVYIGTSGEPAPALLQSRTAPHEVSTDLGLDKLVNRTLTLALLVAGLGACFAMTLRVWVQGARARKAFDSLGSDLRPVIVSVDGSLTISHKRKRWTYRYPPDSPTADPGCIEIASNMEPLFITGDQRYAVAVAGPGGGMPLLLDAKLDSLILSDGEREAFYAACRRALAAWEGTNAAP